MGFRPGYYITDELLDFTWLFPARESAAGEAADLSGNEELPDEEGVKDDL